MFVLRLRRAVRFLNIGLLAVACGSPAFAQDVPLPNAQAPAHISFVEGAVLLERDGDIDETPTNMPLLAGDRVRTKVGRVEILFADGSTLHLDHHSVVDLQSDELVRLIEGRIRLSIPGATRAVSYRIDATHGWAHISEPGDYRLSLTQNAGGGELELAVMRGHAELANEGGQTALRAGERAFVRGGAAPSYAYVANSSALDAFDRWSEARRDERLAASAEYLPEEVRPYAASFERYGYWRDEPVYGHVWYPRVAVGWRPYYYGRWAGLRPYGWTWIAHDPWGWPTHHYGRWGISTAGAWFWIPGRSWGAAWVSWAYAPGYVSWCPLGWNNRAIFQINVFNAHRGYYPWHAWTVVPRGHFGRGFVHHNVVRVTHLDHRTVSAFAHGDRPPEIVGRAVPRASAPIRVAGTAAGRRDATPLYTNVPADRGRLTTDGARVRVPASRADAAGRPSSGVAPDRAVPRERAVPTTPAVRSNRSLEPTRISPGARPGDVGRSDPAAGVPGQMRRSDAPGTARPAETPGMRPRIDDAPRSAPSGDPAGAARPGTAVPRYQPAPSRGGSPAPRGGGDASAAPSRVQPPVYRRPTEVPQQPPQYRNDAPRPSYEARPSYDARPQAIPRGGPAGPAQPSPAPQFERRGPDRAPSGSIQRGAPPSQPSARPSGGQPSALPSGGQPSARPSGGQPSAPPAGARPRGGSGGRRN